MNNSECLKLLLKALKGDFEDVKKLIESVDSKHNSKEFKALLAEVKDTIKELESK